MITIKFTPLGGIMCYHVSMSDEKPIIPRGQPTIGRQKRVVEDTIYFKFAMLKSQHQYILSRAESLNISAAEYLRRLIEQDMEGKG